MRAPAIIALALGLAGCGAGTEGPVMQIGFKRQALECTIDQLQAKLQNDRVVGSCPLMVNPDDTVSGTCPAVPTGMRTTFRLEYYIVEEAPTGEMKEVQLAVAVKILDLTDFKRKTAVLEFSEGELMTNFDDDDDGLSNIIEVCTGRDPLVFDS
jgi:hypothetical protein